MFSGRSARVIFSILRSATWKIRVLVMMVLALSAILFAAVLFYGKESKKVNKLAQSRALLQHFSLQEKIIQNIDSYRFTEVRKTLDDNRHFLSEVKGFNALEESIVYAQSLPRYGQLLDVIETKTKKFADYTKGKTSNIENQLEDLIKKMEVEKTALDRQEDFYSFITSRFEKIKRISENTKLSKAVSHEVDAYIQSFDQELGLLKNLVAAKNASIEQSNIYQKDFKSVVENLDEYISKKENYLAVIEWGSLIAMAVVFFALCGLLTLTFLKSVGVFKHLNIELESWLLDYSRSLYERDMTHITGASDDFYESLNKLVSHYGQLQTIGDLVETKLPFITVIASKDGQILWGNRSFKKQAEGSRVQQISDLWHIEDKIWFNDDQFEGLCELRSDHQVKFEYFVVPLRNHEKYFIVFSPLERVLQSKNKMLDDHLSPLQDALEGVLSSNYHVRNYERVKYPKKVNHILELVTSVNALIQTERQASAKRLDILLKDLKSSEASRKVQTESMNEVKRRLDSYREGIRGIKAYYVEMLEKQDQASQILLDSVSAHDSIVKLSQIMNQNAKILSTSTLKSGDKLEVTLKDLMSKGSDVTLSKMSLFFSDMMKNIKTLEHDCEQFQLKLGGYEKLLTGDYENLSKELGDIDKSFIELISTLYEDVVHLNYRISGVQDQPRPSESV